MKIKRRSAKSFRLAVLCCMLFLAGCTHAVTVKVMPYVGITTYPPKEAATVTVLRDDPLRPHKVLGHVIVEPDHPLPVEEAERILRETAASMGADAVVVMSNMTMQAGANSWQTSGGQLITAVAVKYED